MEQCRPKIFICVTFAVWSIFLLRGSHLIANESRKWLSPLSMETFQNYERYADERNEHQSNFNTAPGYHQKRFLIKRDVTAENTPKMFKFGVEDAREPDEATKEVIRKHRAQELAQKDKIVKRIKRRVPKTEPRYIKFDVTDAKEPDEITRELIRQSRAKELKTTSHPVKMTTSRSPKHVTQKRKRARRSTQITQPKFIKFELADAREPKQNIREMIQNIQTLNSKAVTMNSSSYHQSNDSGIDSQVEESKKLFFYQAVPPKSKRIANTVPIEVKKIIDLMIRDNKALAYYKYFTPNQEAKLKPLDKAKPIIAASITPQLSVPVTSNLVNIYQEPAYVQRLVPIPISVQTIPVNSLLPSDQQNPNGASSHPVIVPATINNHDFYHPIATIPQPHSGTYQQSSPYIKVVPAMSQYFKEIPTAPVVSSHLSTNAVTSNEISKSYPDSKIAPLDGYYRYGKKLNFYPQIQSQQLISPNDQSNHNVLNMDPNSQSQQTQQTIPNQIEIKKEQQQTALKNNQEFQELSSLIGKSPTDQIHGLAYLLAKEMQRNKRLNEQRPQDNTSPVLFHPERNVGINNEVRQESVELTTQPELISHSAPEPLPQSYPAAIQHNSAANHAPGESPEPTVPFPPTSPPPTSYSVVKNLGLSPNYAGIDHFDEPPKIHPDVANELGLQYASKYAFGYRVRDFYSGNDFGHKQNRDLDGVTRGQYHILLPDGRVQNVIYHADDTGFHADVSFETGHR